MERDRGLCSFLFDIDQRKKKRNIFSRVETYKKNKKVNAVAGLTNLSFFQGDFFFTF
jgi:hypothetical protein